MKLLNKLGLYILALVIISPLGLILPAMFNANSAWGEWSLEEIQALTGSVPAGMAKLAAIWHPLLPDYNFPFSTSTNLAMDSLAYIFSGFVGTMLCICLTLLWINFSKWSIQN